MSVLFDADVASTSQLAGRRRARTTVADAEAAHRAELLTELVVEFRRARTALDQVPVTARAAAYDMAHPSDTPLVEELLAAVAGDQYEAVA